jgi:hypothetical protein
VASVRRRARAEAVGDADGGSSSTSSRRRRPWRANSGASVARGGAGRPACWEGVRAHALARGVAEDVGVEHLAVVLVGLEHQLVGAGYCCAYLPRPTCMRDCSSVRKVCDSTTGRPPRESCRCRGAAALALKGTSGLMPNIRSMPWSSTTEACMVRRSAPSTKCRPRMSTGGYRPGRAALAWIAREIGTSSQPGPPKRTASPLSRSTATTYSCARACGSRCCGRGFRTPRAGSLDLRVVEDAGGHQAAQAADQVGRGPPKGASSSSRQVS